MKANISKRLIEIYLRQASQKYKKSPDGTLCIHHGNFADVFRGTGFDTPTRFRRVKGQWMHVSGPHISPAVLNG